MPAPSQFTGGLQVPLQANSSGGLRLLEGDEYLMQTVEILCGDGDSDNPFNDGVGVGSSAIFASAADLAWRSKTRKEIEDAFDDLEAARLARLRSVNFEEGAAAGEVNAVIRFQSIETDDELEVSTSLRRT